MHKPKEALGKWVGVAPNCGDVLTYRILTSDTKQVVCRSVLRPAKGSSDPNYRLISPPADGEHIPQILKTLGDVVAEDGMTEVIYETSDTLENSEDGTKSNGDNLPDNLPVIEDGVTKLPTFSPEELIGKIFLRKDINGDLVKATVAKKILDRDAENHENIKFLVETGDIEEVIAYTELCDIINEQLENPDDQPLHTFKAILDHDGPIHPSDPK